MNSHKHNSAVSVALVVGLLAGILGAAIWSSVVIRRMDHYAARNFATLTANATMIERNAADIAAIKERVYGGTNHFGNR